jgi:hypothetical protein
VFVQRALGRSSDPPRTGCCSRATQGPCCPPSIPDRSTNRRRAFPAYNVAPAGRRQAWSKCQVSPRKVCLCSRRLGWYVAKRSTVAQSVEGSRPWNFSFGAAGPPFAWFRRQHHNVSVILITWRSIVGQLDAHSTSQISRAPWMMLFYLCCWVNHPDTEQILSREPTRVPSPTSPSLQADFSPSL